MSPQAVPSINKLSTKTQLIIAFGFLVLILIIGYVIYRSGKKTGQAEGVINISNPVTDTPASGNQGEQTSTSEIKIIAEQLHKDMDGGNIMGHNMAPWERLLVMSDTDFVKVYNEFNYMYQKESEQTFTKWVDKESSFLSSVYTVLTGGLYYVFGSGDWPSMQKSVMTRLAKLNLK